MRREGGSFQFSGKSEMIVKASSTEKSSRLSARREKPNNKQSFKTLNRLRNVFKIEAGSDR